MRFRALICFALARVLGVPCSRGTQGHSPAFAYHDLRYLWVASAGVYHAAEMGYDRLDDLLHRRYPCVLVLPPAVLILEDGRLLVGSDSRRVG